MKLIKKINKHFITISCLLGLSNIAFAETSLWKITKGDDYIYLGGTIHILPETELPLPKEFQHAYQTTDILVLETQLPLPEDKKAQTAMIMAMRYPVGQQLSDFLSKKTYLALSQYLRTLSLNIQTFNQFKPGFAITMMAIMAAKKANISGVGVDAYFTLQAKKEKKTLLYLEDFSAQIAMIANLGKGNEEAFIKANLLQMKTFQHTMVQLIAAWRRGDITALANLVTIPMMKEDIKTFHNMIVKRNNNWLPKIEALFNNDSKELVLVGVAHLLGQEGVTEQLRNKGYQIKKLNIKK